MQLECQQFTFEKVKVPQIQFLDRVLIFQLSTVAVLDVFFMAVLWWSPWTFHRRSFGRVVHASGDAETRGHSAVAVPRQVCYARRYAMTGARFPANIPQVQLLCKFVMPVVMQ